MDNTYAPLLAPDDRLVDLAEDLSRPGTVDGDGVTRALSRYRKAGGSLDLNTRQALDRGGESGLIREATAYALFAERTLHGPVDAALAPKPWALHRALCRICDPKALAVVTARKTEGDYVPESDPPALTNLGVAIEHDMTGNQPSGIVPARPAVAKERKHLPGPVERGLMAAYSADARHLYLKGFRRFHGRVKDEEAEGKAKEHGTDTQADNLVALLAEVARIARGMASSGLPLRHPLPLNVQDGDGDGLEDRHDPNSPVNMRILIDAELAAWERGRAAMEPAGALPADAPAPEDERGASPLERRR